MVNVSPTNEAQLFFSQARKLRAGEEEEAALTRRPHEAEVPPADEGSEDEIDEQPVRRKAEGGKKRK